jgi:hypothetical protein
MFRVPEQYRVRNGFLGTDKSVGNNGMFLVPRPRDPAVPLRVIASDGQGWEHVSVSLPYRAPTWDEMCRVKDLFWGDEDTVVQYHPPRSEYVNNHAYCLHLWRPVGAEVPRPPAIMVGVPG